MITKEQFIKSVEAIQKKLDSDAAFADQLSKAFPNARSADLLPENDYVTNAMILLLQEQMNDTTPDVSGYSWIEWFIFETDSGRKSNKLKAYDKDGAIIPLADAGQLYDYLQSINVNRFQYLVGEVLDYEKDSWLFQGIYSTEEKADAKCVTDDFFLARVELDFDEPREPKQFDYAYYPRHDEFTKEKENA